MLPSCTSSIKSERRTSICNSSPVAPSSWIAVKWCLKTNFAIPLSLRISTRWSSVDNSGEIESKSILQAFVCRLSSGNHFLKSVEVPLCDLARSTPDECFFHPKSIPVIEMIKIKTNNVKPVIRCIFLNARNHRAWIFRLATFFIYPALTIVLFRRLSWKNIFQGANV